MVLGYALLKPSRLTILVYAQERQWVFYVETVAREHTYAIT